MRQRVNIGLVTIFSQAIQITLVGLGLTGFFVLFGFLAIPEATAAAWTTLDRRRRARRLVTSAGATLVITEPLIRVAALPRRVRRRCTSRCCCRPTRRTARSSPTTSPRSCAKLWPCAACTGRPAGRRRRDRDEPATTDLEIRLLDDAGRDAPGDDAVQPGVGHRRRRSSASSCCGPSSTPAATSPRPTLDEQIVGGSFGFLGRHLGEPSLHSHVTGILPGVRRTGLGRAMKLHQRAWAADHGLAWVTWTFDPLVRRNAWFNLGVLGAHVHEYLVDFYGPIDDAINAGDESDRLLVAWPVGDDGPTAPPTDPTGDGRRADARGHRRAAPHRPGRRRRRGATASAPSSAAASPPARRVVGFTRDGDYLVVACR